jgi:hypothetical protein
VDNIVVVVFEAHKVFVEGISEEFVELPMVIELTLNNSSNPFVVEDTVFVVEDTVFVVEDTVFVVLLVVEHTAFEA